MAARIYSTAPSYGHLGLELRLDHRVAPAARPHLRAPEFAGRTASESLGSKTPIFCGGVVPAFSAGGGAGSAGLRAHGVLSPSDPWWGPAAVAQAFHRGFARSARRRRAHGTGAPVAAARGQQV